MRISKSIFRPHQFRLLSAQAADKTLFAAVTSIIHLLALATLTYAQVGLSLVGESCSADMDCGFTGDTGDQIGCGVDEICGGKGAQCSYNGNYHGFTEACVSRESFGADHSSSSELMNFSYRRKLQSHRFVPE
jgi:hypothetical protein